MNKIVLWLGREPAQVAAIVSAAVQLTTSLAFSLTEEQQGLINAATVLILGFATALTVSAEKAAPLLAGVVQAVMAVALSFGLLLAPQVQSSVMTFTAALVAFWLHGVVTAPIGPTATVSNRHTAR